MENTVIQHTFLKSDQSQKTQIFNKNPRTPDLVKKTSSVNTGQVRPEYRFSNCSCSFG